MKNYHLKEFKGANNDPRVRVVAPTKIKIQDSCS